MRVLIVDDDIQVRETLRKTLEEDDGWEVEAQGFEGLSETLLRVRPDLVVLDLLEGQPPDGRPEGNTAFCQIRDSWFCPVVVYTGHEAVQDFEHPLAARIIKGADSDIAVLAELANFVPHAEMIRSVHEEFDARIREALRDSVHALAAHLDAEAGDSEEPILSRAVRRLVAARVDIRASGEAKLRAWERWVVPALGDHLLTADLLRRKEADWEKAEAFRLVLTPSCDLASRGAQERKADKVLVARCEALKKLGKVEIKPGRPLGRKARDKLRSILTEGMADNFVPIPCFRGHVPLMVANLRRLELIKLDSIDLGAGDAGGEAADTAFDRVASTDSPFREMVVWAYLRITGRPGMPDIDVDRWMNDITNPLATSGQQA